MCHAADIKRVKVYGNDLTKKYVQIIPCILALYDNGGTIKLAGCLQEKRTLFINIENKVHKIILP